VQLYGAREEIEATGVRVVLVGQATPRHAAHFRRTMKIELPVLADEHRESYKAAGAKIATMGELLGPRMIAKGAQASRKLGVHQGRTIGHPAQLGGAMIVTPDGAVAWSHMSEDASDNAEPQEVIAAAQAVAAGGT
jgi:peroxiredoxin